VAARTKRVIHEEKTFYGVTKIVDGRLRCMQNRQVCPKRTGGATEQGAAPPALGSHWALRRCLWVSPQRTGAAARPAEALRMRGSGPLNWLPRWCPVSARRSRLAGLTSAPPGSPWQWARHHPSRPVADVPMPAWVRFTGSSFSWQSIDLPPPSRGPCHQAFALDLTFAPVNRGMARCQVAPRFLSSTVICASQSTLFRTSYFVVRSINERAAKPHLLRSAQAPACSLRSRPAPPAAYSVQLSAPDNVTPGAGVGSRPGDHGDHGDGAITHPPPLATQSTPSSLDKAIVTTPYY